MPVNLPVINLNDEQLKAKAVEYDKLLSRNLFDNLYLLKGIYEEQLYKYLGYDSLEDYALKRLNISRRTMFAYLQVASKFYPVISNPDAVQRVALSAIPLRKLIILANLSHSDTSDLMEKGEVKLGGNIYTIADLKEMDMDMLRALLNGKDEEPAKEITAVPFDKVYKRAERFFTHILNDVFNCPDITEPDKAEIEIHINAAVQIYDSYKKMDDAVKGIK